MATNAEHGVHIQTLYKQIESLEKSCDEQHKAGIGGLQRIHERIDSFTNFMLQISEVNKDVQSLIAHQKTLESEQKSLESQIQALQARLVAVEKLSESNAEVAKWIKSAAGIVVTAVIVGVLGLLGLKA